VIKLRGPVVLQKKIRRNKYVVPHFAFVADFILKNHGGETKNPADRGEANGGAGTEKRPIL
jgi:hypothetical protein